MSCLCGSDSWTDRNRYNATAASATDRDAVGRDIVADNATDSLGAAARANADGRKGSSGVAANPGDSVRRAVPVRIASYAGASCCCHDRYRGGCCPNYDCDRGPNPDGAARPAGVGVALPAPGSAAVGAVAASVRVPATAGFDPAVAAANDPRVRETGESDPAAVGRCAVAGVAVPSAAVVPDCRAVVVGVAAGAAREQPDSPDSAPHRGLVSPARWQGHSLPTSRRILSETGLISSEFSCSSKVLSFCRRREVSTPRTWQLPFHAEFGTNAGHVCRFTGRFDSGINDMGYIVGAD